MATDGEYHSSEELARQHSADVFASAKKDAAATNTTEKDKVKKVLDKYISDHKSTDKVRDMAKEAGRTAEQQLDLSAEIVVILEKIKSDLR